MDNKGKARQILKFKETIVNEKADKQFNQYIARVNHLIEQGYPEDRALRLVRDDAALSDEVWHQLVEVYEVDSLEND